MAAEPTYTSIATTTIGSAVASYTFSSIASTYTDLILIAKGGVVSSGGSFYLRFNGDTASNYSATSMYGTGSVAASNRFTGTSMFASGNAVGIGSNTTTIFHFNNYDNTTTYKTALMRSSNASGDVEATVGLWRSTSAITSITILGTGANIDAGVTFTLYGIAAA